MQGRGYSVLFQSAPAIAGGRCAGIAPAPNPRCSGFNPRPPLLAGDAPASRQHLTPGVVVSIRARHCWRAMLNAHGATGAAGRVSIRARHCWRAMRGRGTHHGHQGEFQSAPAIAGGRCSHLRRRRRRRQSRQFQSAPAIAGGRCWGPAACGLVENAFQSAPAIAGGRCHDGCAMQPRRICFNPRPPLLAGDALEGATLDGANLVSIRARHCWRAMPAAFHLGEPGRKVSIRARHCWWAMRAMAAAMSEVAACFNPRPPLLAGDARERHAPPAWEVRFNPRPPLLAGDAMRAGCPPWRRRIVSIRARHCWRAMPDVFWSRAHWTAGFNPRPPLLAGDARLGNKTHCEASVSIRARHCWRAMHGRRTYCAGWDRVFQSAPAIGGWFQSAPAIAGGRCGKRL